MKLTAMPIRPTVSEMRAIDDAREQVAAGPVGAEQEHGAVLRRADGMEVAGNMPQNW